MGESYFNLKHKLEELGYNNILPIEAVPLVECILADLLQTTRSLQHYMELSKEALMQRDSLKLEAEPYKCDNAKLIQENSHLHREIMKLTEENFKITRDCKRNIKMLTEEVLKKDTTIAKLQHDVRDLSLRGLCANTLSSRNKSRRKDSGDDSSSKICFGDHKKESNLDQDLIEFKKKIQVLEEKNNAYCDEILLLRNQVEHRENEIIRLNMQLEGGRPLKAMSKDCCHLNSNTKIQDLLSQVNDLESENSLLKKELESGLEKQHEAMLRAMNLAEKNKTLQEELLKVDKLALKVEEDCNKRLSTMSNEVNFLQTRLESMTLRNSELERELAQCSKASSPKLNQIQESLNIALKEKETLHNEIKILVDINKSLKEKLVTATKLDSDKCDTFLYKKYPTTSEMQSMFENERKKYERHIVDLQEKLSESLKVINTHVQKCQENCNSPLPCTPNKAFIKDLHNRLCDSEQKVLMLKKENDELRSKMYSVEENNKENYKDVVRQLNNENSMLSKDNISLSQQLHNYRNLNSATLDRCDYSRKEIQKSKEEVEKLRHDIEILTRDKQEYNKRYKEASELVEKLKRDLTFKQKEIDQLEEENCSYKMTNRTGKASVDHLRDECNFLKEQLKRMQTEVIKEKTLASQIKNIQIETERSTSEVQNELLNLQKKLSLANGTIETYDKRCKELQSEIMTLKNDKSKLLDNIRCVDQERDKLVIDLDHKTENINVLEQKIRSQTYGISKLENEVSELKRKLNVSKVSEHKLLDNETQVKFLNGEIMRLTQQLDNAVIENKHLQNSLADANGTLQITKIEYDKSRKEVEGLRQQLQHYVAEIRRIEELLSQKEAERSDMLEHFASLSVEANILENTNHSLESESASKSHQLQTYLSKIEALEEKVIEKESVIENQSSRIATMTCRVSALENEVKLITEEKAILEQNNAYLKQMCNNLQSEKDIKCGDAESDLKIYENRIKSLSGKKAQLELERDELRDKLMTSEKLLSNARREIVELKLTLQDATSETKALKERVTRLSTREIEEIHETTLTKDMEIPLIMQDIHEISHDEDEESSQYHEIRKRISKYTHSSTL